MVGVHRLDAVVTGPQLAGAVEAFLAQVPNTHTARAYRVALRALVGELGAATPVAALDADASAEAIGAWFTDLTRCARLQPGGALRTGSSVTRRGGSAAVPAPPTAPDRWIGPPSRRC
jgi:hypothetical protein